MYCDLENQSQVFEINLKLSDIKQGSNSVTQYFHLLKQIWQDLDLFDKYEWKSTEDQKHYKKIVENGRIYKFLAGLNVEFDEVRGRIIGKANLPNINEVFSEVRREESRQHVMMGKKPVDTEESSALVVEATANKASDQTNKPRVWCDHCNKPRHTRETCWKIHGKPANHKSNRQGEKSIRPPASSANSAESTPFNKEQIDQILKLLKTTTTYGNPSVSLAQTGNCPHAFSCLQLRGL